MRVTVLHTQAPARTALRERLHRVGSMQNVQLRAQVTFARDGQIIPGCFEIQDTRARCTQILVLTRSAATHCDACASVCVCPARGQRAWRQNGQEFMRADVPALTSCSLYGCTMRGMPEPVARKPQPFIAPLPPAPPRPARAKEDTPQHDSVDLAWPLCPPASRTWPPHCSHQRSTSVLGQAASR